MEMATEHLIQTGRRDIAYVKPVGPEFVTAGLRYDGYAKKMAEARLPLRTIEICDDPETRRASLRGVFESEKMPEALLCYYDDIALDAVEVLQGMGYTPGKDVAVVGFNGQEGTERGKYPITTVRQPIEQMCGMAFDSLQAQIADRTTPRLEVVLKPSLVVRESSGR
jgi:DNA-binding LacI/PurR family transcriptional regulator